MGLHDSLAAGVASSHFAHHAKASGLAITPLNGSAASYDAIIYDERKERRYDENGEYFVMMRTVHLLSADVQPLANATATIGSDDYAIISHARTEAGLLGLELENVSSGRVTSPDVFRP